MALKSGYYLFVKYAFKEKSNGMRKIDDELIQKIEKAFGFPLYDWQKTYLKDESYFTSSGRSGKTFIVCLKILLTNDKKMKKSDLNKFPDGFNIRKRNAEQFCSELVRIDKFLKENGIETILED